MHLLVEDENVAARTLYEGKLGYKELFVEQGATALRADVEAGTFEEVEVDTVVLAKDL